MVVDVQQEHWDLLHHQTLVSCNLHQDSPKNVVHFVEQQMLCLKISGQTENSGFNSYNVQLNMPQEYTNVEVNLQFACMHLHVYLACRS